MAQYTKPTFRGLLIPDERIKEGNISATDSSYSQAGPMPGVPAPQADTDLNLEATGTQSANKQLRIATQRGGHPDRGGATFRWSNATDAADAWRGWTQPNTLTSWQVMDVGNALASSGTQVAHDAHAVGLPNGYVAIVWHRKRIDGINIYKGVRFQTMAPDGTLSTAITVWETLDAITQETHPCLMLLPNGRLMLYHYFEDITKDVVQVQSFYSDDDGANWTLATSSALPDAIDVSTATVGYSLNTRPSAKMRACYSGGQVLLLLSFRSNDTSTGSHQDGIAQYASSDLGLSFEQVEIWPRTVTGTQAEAVATANGFDVFLITLDGSGDPLIIRRNLASAFIPISTASNLAGPAIFNAYSWDPGYHAGARVWGDCELATAKGEDGLLYVMARGRATGGTYAANNVGDLRIAMDRSGGADLAGSYELMGQGTSQPVIGSSFTARAGLIWWAESTADFPRYFGLCAAQGRLALFHSWSADTGTRDESVARMMLGGWGDVTLGQYFNSGGIPRRVCWDYTWLPIEEPDDIGTPANAWTITTAGTNASNVTNGYLTVTTGGGNRNWNRVPPGTVAEGIIAHFGCQHVSQTGALNKYILAQFRQADGSDNYTIDVWIRAGNVLVEDNNGASQLGQLSIDAQTKGVEVLVFFKGSKTTVLARQIDHDADKTWSTVCSNATVSDSGTGTSKVQFGHRAASTAESRWLWFHFVSDEYAGLAPSSGGFTNPTDLDGAPFTSLAKTYVDDGVFVRAVDGPTAPGNTWNIDTRYQYPVTNVLPSSEPSPAKGWRSTDETEQTIAFATTGVNRYSEIGLYLEGINFRNATLAGHNGSAWVTLASIDTATGQTTLAYLQGGTSVGVNPSGSTAPGRYFELDELAGGTVRVNPSSGADFSRTITRSGPGQWTEQAGYLRASVEMASTPVVLSNTGTLDIWSPRILIAIHNVPSSYKKFRLVIPATQNTAAGYYKIGQMALGPLHLFSQDYSWGRTVETAPNTELVTYRDGSRSSFKRGENRRAVSFGWGEGVDTTAIQGSAPAPDYIEGSSTSGAPVIGYRGDMPSLLERLNAYTAGPNMPLVYCPSIVAGSTGNDVKTIQGYSASIYGRLVSGVQTDSIVGEELDGQAGELMRISNVRIEEEL